MREMKGKRETHFLGAFLSFLGLAAALPEALAFGEIQRERGEEEV